MTVFDDLFDDLAELVDDTMAMLISGVVGLFARHPEDPEIAVPVELTQHGGIEL